MDSISHDKSICSCFWKSGAEIRYYILNTATFDYKLSLLTENESILYSELAHAILKELSTEISTRLLSELEDNFESIRNRKDEIIEKILECIPANWNVSIDMVYSKMNQLFDQKWMDDCWKTFIEYFNEAAKWKI